MYNASIGADDIEISCSGARVGRDGSTAGTPPAQAGYHSGQLPDLHSRGIALAHLKTWNTFRIMMTRVVAHLLVIFGIVLLLAGCATRPDTSAAYDDTHSAQITDEVPTNTGQKIPVTTVRGP